MAEVLLTPVTYKAVGALKRVEQLDAYDRAMNFKSVCNVACCCADP